MRLTSASAHFRTLAILTLSCLLTSSTATVRATPPTDADFAALHTEIGRTMDRRYYEAGRRVDLALFDFEEMARQGRSAPRDLVRRAERADREMRARWLALEERRAALDVRRRALPPQAPLVLRIENLEVAAGDAGWFGLRSARLEWASGASVPLAPDAFKGGALISNYGYRVEPSTGAFIYGKGSGQETMVAGFEAPAGASGNAALVVSAIDDDKPGATRIRITLNGASVFEGENPFPPTPWTEHRFPVPEAALRATGSEPSDAGRLHADLLALQRDVEVFGAWADARAGGIEKAATPVRAGLEYVPARFAPDWWEHHFLRGVSYVPFAQEMEHHFKSFRHLGATMLYSYSGHYNKPSELPKTLAVAKALGLPYVQFTYPMRNEARDRLYLGDPEAMLASARAFLREAEGDTGVPVHLAVDEPNFRDEYAEDPAVLRAFRAYMAERRPALEAAGIRVPQDPKPLVTMASEADRALWMEWQVFKTRHMAGNYRHLWEGLKSDGRLPFVIIQDHRADDPQQASHVTMGAALPLLSTDLYSNGSTREALVMDLVNNATNGQAILTAGAGYSDHTPDRFRRSLAVAMAHADGVLQWTDIYFSKYRDPIAFWKTTTDDQGRSVLANWRPEYWAIMEEEYARMAEADRYLFGTTSQAPAAVLFSERTAIADSATSGEPYVATVHGLYSDLLRRGRPLDALYVENLTPEVLARYRALLLPDGRVLTESEANLLRAWVRAGGTLIASGAATLYDEWGRPREDFGLADVFGARYASEGKGATSYTVDGAAIPYDASAAYLRVAPLATAKVVGTWSNGDPALLRNDFGRGRAWLFTGRGHFARAGGREAASGLYGSGYREERAIVARLVDDAVGERDIRAENAPDGVEMQVREKGGATIVHLTDWNDNRTVKGLRLRIDRPGRWRVFYPAGKPEEKTFNGPQTITVRPFRVHEMVVVESVE